MTHLMRQDARQLMFVLGGKHEPAAYIDDSSRQSDRLNSRIRKNTELKRIAVACGIGGEVLTQPFDVVLSKRILRPPESSLDVHSEALAQLSILFRGKKIPGGCELRSLRHQRR